MKRFGSRPFLPMTSAMDARRRQPRSASQLFAVYAAVSLVPVLVLGIVMASALRRSADTQGLLEARTEAALVAQAVIEPALPNDDLAAPLSTAEDSALVAATERALQSNGVLRLRVRTLAGQVVFSSDGTGFAATDDDDALAAAHGALVAHLTRLNADLGGATPPGPRVVEVYEPLLVGSAARQVGVLEMYLPYAPIAHDVTAGLTALYRDLAIGLGALYLLLAGISLSVTRRLRGQVAANAFLAEHDVLTGLPNRSRFHRQVREGLADGAHAGGAAPAALAVAVIDLDRFKEVNDTIGHQNGDRLLAELGARLAEAVRDQDSVARLGGDEFGVVLAGIDDEAEVLAVLGRLREIIAAEADMDGLPLLAEASIGVAMAPTDGTDVDTLLQHADIAMYVAKSTGAGVVRYDSGHDHYDAAKLALVAELRRALTGDELVMHYQPKVAVVSGQVIAVEALVRWAHPERGLLYPDSFLPIAEQTGLIEPLTRWVLQRALAQLNSWGSAGSGLSLAVNISARNLARTDFASHVMAALNAAGVAPARLILEVTETALVTDPTRAAATLRILDVAGVSISLDDFGRGQTSLGYLSELPLREIKIDKSFVLDMLETPAHASIVQSVINLGHNLGFHVVAEGVETGAALDRLADLGCDVAQGYYLARPMPAENFPAWIADYVPIAHAALGV